MGRYEVDLIVSSGRQLKNVNWRNGDLNPYVVAWVDSSSKCSTIVASDGDTEPDWVDAKLTISIPSDSALDEATLFLEVYHYGEAEGTKPLVGSARLRLQEVVDEVGVGSKMSRTIKLKRPSGRPQGKIDIKVAIKEPNRYDQYAQPPTRSEYGQGSSYASGGGYGYGQPAYGAPATGYPYTSAPVAGGYAYGGATQAPAAGGYAYGGATQAPAAGGYAYGGAPQAPQKKSSFGLGTGLAVGAAAGLLGGLALSEGLDYVEDKIADKVVDRIEERAEDDIAGDYYDGEF